MKGFAAAATRVAAMKCSGHRQNMSDYLLEHGWQYLCFARKKYACNICSKANLNYKSKEALQRATVKVTEVLG